jgi:aryl-alcohol dehydrogenase-like predicted oxidoreductase
MHYRKLGRTDIQVCPLCLGGNVFGWTADEQTSFAVLDVYVEAGGNFIDTANSYGRGTSETVLGRWMKARGNREQIILATKVSSQMSDDGRLKGLARQTIMEAVDESLTRLQTDYIDLYQAHWDDPNTPLEETMAAFNDLIKAGKVRAIGASNYSAQRLREALTISQEHGYTRYETLQPYYNLVDRADYESELEPLCRSEELGVIVYFSLAAGFLTGKYQRGQEIPNTPRAQMVQRRYMNDHGWQVLDTVERIARQYDATPSQIALAGILARPGITGPIASATSVRQLHELMGTFDIQLDTEALTALGQG